MICPIALTSSKHPCHHRVRNWTGETVLLWWAGYSRAQVGRGKGFAGGWNSKELWKSVKKAKVSWFGFAHHRLVSRVAKMAPPPVPHGYLDSQSLAAYRLDAQYLCSVQKPVLGYQFDLWRSTGEGSCPA